jgi:hypothetical protein
MQRPGDTPWAGFETGPGNEQLGGGFDVLDHQSVNVSIFSRVGVTGDDDAHDAGVLTQYLFSNPWPDGAILDVGSAAAASPLLPPKN